MELAMMACRYFLMITIYTILFHHTHCGQFYKRKNNVHIINDAMKTLKVSPIQCELRCQRNNECSSTAKKDGLCVLIGSRVTGVPVLASVTEKVILPSKEPHCVKLCKSNLYCTKFDIIKFVYV